MGHIMIPLHFLLTKKDVFHYINIIIIIFMIFKHSLLILSFDRHKSVSSITLLFKYINGSGTK